MLFLKHAWFWFVTMLFFMLSVPVIPNNDWFSAKEEVRSNAAFYGADANARFIERAQKRFNHWFVDTGIYGKSIELTRPASTTRQRTRPDQLVDVEVSAFGTYVDQAWDGVLRALYRWETNKHWYVMLIISMLVCLNEGVVRRTMRPATVLYRSPAGFHVVGHFLIANVVGILLVLPWIPIALTWWVWCLMLPILCPFWVYAALSLPVLGSQELR